MTKSKRIGHWRTNAQGTTTWVTEHMIERTVYTLSRNENDRFINGQKLLKTYCKYCYQKVYFISLNEKQKYFNNNAEPLTLHQCRIKNTKSRVNQKPTITKKFLAEDDVTAMYRRGEELRLKSETRKKIKSERRKKSKVVDIEHKEDKKKARKQVIQKSKKKNKRQVIKGPNKKQRKQKVLNLYKYLHDPNLSQGILELLNFQDVIHILYECVIPYIEYLRIKSYKENSYKHSNKMKKIQALLTNQKYFFEFHENNGVKLENIMPDLKQNLKLLEKYFNDLN